MPPNYRQLAENVRRRINPDNFQFKQALNEELRSLSYSDVLTYIRLAMKGVEPEYTEKSHEAGERVKTHLASKLTDVEFRYQGSVMTNTHIKGYSDVDLLTISNKFYYYDSTGARRILDSSEERTRFFNSSIEKLITEVNSPSYQGQSLEDLRNLRLNSEEILSDAYEICDTGKPKAIKITNKNLKRDVDIVIANWYDDITSIINNKGDYRGIQIYNRETHARENADYPFLSINRINERSAATEGRLKKMIRFLKNVKADSSQKIDLSSFDINAICYDINIAEYQHLPFYELVPIIYNQMKEICTSQTKSDSIISVDGREYIFRYDIAKLQNLKQLLAEVEGAFIDVRNTMAA